MYIHVYMYIYILSTGGIACTSTFCCIYTLIHFVKYTYLYIYILHVGGNGHARGGASKEFALLALTSRVHAMYISVYIFVYVRLSIYLHMQMYIIGENTGFACTSTSMRATRTHNAYIGGNRHGRGGAGKELARLAITCRVHAAPAAL